MQTNIHCPRALAMAPDQAAVALPPLAEEDLRQLLVTFNDTTTDYPRDVCLHQLFEAQAARTPDAVAVVFEDERLTYHELNRRSNQLARRLQACGVGPDALVAICMERSLELVVGVLGILKAGGAYVPLDPTYPAERLAYMLEDAQAPVLVTQRRLVAGLPAHGARLILLDDDDLASAAEPMENPVNGVTPDNLAYMIYTSGSTGKPKGAMNTHRGICNRLLWMQEAYRLTMDDRVLQKTPFSFDVSVWEFFWPLLSGARLVVARPEGHSDSAYLVRLIAAQGVTTLHFVPSMLHAFLEERDLKRCASLTRVICSGEALPVDLHDRFFTRLGAALHNLYGPTEAAVDVTYWACMYQNDERTIPIGRPIANTYIYLLDRQSRLVPFGAPGELHIGGVALARGYANRPDLTAEKFVPNPFADEPGARLYKTGDLARYRPDGAIEYLGRLDHQVKICGIRIELGEIEAALGAHPAVREVVVMAREDTPGDKRLVGYIVADQQSTPSSRILRDFLAERLPAYMRPAAIVPLDALPLTPNGKVDRTALPAPDWARLIERHGFMAPRTSVAELLATVWSPILHIAQIESQDNFFDLGGHSLIATQMISRVRDAFGVDVSMRDLFEHPTLAALANHIEATQQAGTSSPTPAPQLAAHDGRRLLSYAQQQLWFLDQLDPNQPTYNISLARHLTGSLDVAALEQSLNYLVRRHETLRTTFALVAGQPAQIVAPALALPLVVADLRQVPSGARADAAQRRIALEARRPFDLARGPLLRAHLLWLTADEHVLLLTMHHIISDGWSLDVLCRELGACYHAALHGVEAPLPVLPVQYADVAQWQRDRLRGDTLEEQLAYWRAQLAGAPPLLELPTDRPRPAAQTYRGATEAVLLSPALHAALQALSRRLGVTLFMTLLAAFQTVLLRYTGQEDLVVGTPIAGRTRTETEGLIGFFVNTLALRTSLAGNPRFTELLGRVREAALEAYAHQDAPFEKLVEALQPARDPRYAPLVQVMFELHNTPRAALELAGLAVEPLAVQEQTAQLDLTMAVEETSEGLVYMAEYNVDLFDAVTIRRLLGYVRAALEAVVANPMQNVRDLSGGWSRTVGTMELAPVEFDELFT